MIKQIKTWYNKRLEQAKAQSHRQGYDWAAGKLLRGEDCAEAEIEGLTYGRSEPFDQGAREAVIDFDRRLSTRRDTDTVGHYNHIKPVRQSVGSRPYPWPTSP